MLGQSGEETAVRARHATYLLALVEVLDFPDPSESPRGNNTYARWEHDQANARAALTWCRAHDPTLGLRLAASLGWFWIRRGDLVEGEGWLRTFLARTPGEPGVRGRALLGLATLKRDQGFLADAQPLFEASLALFRQVGDDWGIGRNLALLGFRAEDAGDYGQATALATESLAIARQIRAPFSIAWAQGFLAELREMQGDRRQGRSLGEEALRASREAGEPIPGALLFLGRIAQREGDDGRAEVLFREVASAARDQGRMSYLGTALEHLGRLAQQQGAYVRARQSFDESLAIAREIGSDSNVCTALYELGKLALAEGDHVGAYARLAEGLILARRVGRRLTMVVGVLLVGLLSAERGAPARAVRLLGAAAKAHPLTPTGLEDQESADYERSLAVARATLGEEAFEAAWAEGQAMTLEQAIAEALEEGADA